MPLETHDIFILTADARDRGGRNQLEFYGLTATGRVVEIVVDNVRPVFFVPRRQALPSDVGGAERRSVQLRDLPGRKVDAVYFNTRRESSRAADILDRQGLISYETDLVPWQRYLMERFIQGQARVAGAFVVRGGYLRTRNPRLAPCRFDPVFTVASLDIETSVRDKRLYSIAVSCRGPKQAQMVFMRGSPMPAAQQPAWLTYCRDEKHLLETFLGWFARLDPDLIIGWHVVGFDLHFLQQACRRHGLQLTLGRDGRPARINRLAGGRWFADIPGRVVLDGPVLLRGAFYRFEDFRLETVARELLQAGKTIASDENKVAEIDRRFQQDKVALATYNLQDCDLVQRIFETTGLIDLYIRRVQISGLLLDQIGRSAAAFDHFFLPRLHRKGYVAPNTRDVVAEGHSAGGFVMEPVVGLHRDVVVLDFKSLYPTIIRTFKIDPLSRLRAQSASASGPGARSSPLPDAAGPEDGRAGIKAATIRTPQGYCFSATQHILPEFIADLMEQRAKAKRHNDSHLSQAIKILMNSFYGLMGSYGCRFYHPDLPSAITSTGHWLLQGSRRFLENKGYAVLYGDTDSLFVKLRPGKGAQVHLLGQKLAEHLTEYWQQRLAAECGVHSHLEMEYEKYYARFVLPPARGREEGAKKRYVGLRVTGRREKLDFVGMEYVRSDWTPLARKFQYELYDRFFHDREIVDWIRQLAAAVRAGRHDAQLVYHKRLRKPADQYIRNVPPHVKAARMLPRPGRDVRYVITPDGPVPTELAPDRIDYRHYLERQLKPIADTLLGLLGQSFDEITGSRQLSLFD